MIPPSFFCLLWQTDGRPILAPAVTSSPRPILFIGDSLVSGFTPLYRGLVLPHGSYQSFGSIAVRTLRAHGVDARLEIVAYPGALNIIIFPQTIVNWPSLISDSGICLKTVDSPAVVSTHTVDTDVYWKGMEDIFWDGLAGKGGWEERSRDTPHDIFICIGKSPMPSLKPWSLITPHLFLSRIQRLRMEWR